MDSGKLCGKAPVFSDLRDGENPGCLGQSDALLENYHRFLDSVAADTAAGGDSPVEVCRFFEYLDEAVDPAALLAALAAVGRQVWVTVGRGYPLDRLQGYGLYEIRMEGEQ